MTSLERTGKRQEPRTAGPSRARSAGVTWEPRRTGPAYWELLGIRHQDARRLVAAGLRTRQDLATWTREQLLALPGLHEDSFRRCLVVLDRPLASAVPYWTALSVPWPTAWRLSRERIMTVADLRRYRVDHLVKLGFRPLEAQCLLSLAAEAFA